MKKTTLLLLVILMSSTFVSAGTGWYSDFVKINVNGAGTTAPTGWYWIGSDPTFATQLQGANLGTVTSLTIDGCDMKYWADGADRNGGSFFYQIKSADGSTVVVSPIETIWDQAKLFAVNDYQGTKATNINLLAGLTFGTTYQLHVWAKSWGTTQGDSWLTNSSANYVATFTCNLMPVTITGANGIADGTGYSTLKAAFDAINAQADQTNKTIEIKINSSTTETATAALNQPATASWTSLTIYPTSPNVSISGNFAADLIDLNGADNVTINGKLNKTGVAKSLTIIQGYANSANLTSTIRFYNDALNNTISYCTIQGSCLKSSTGVVFFDTGTTTGNTGNTISYNDFKMAGTTSPLNVIFSKGSSATILNSNNTIDNNNFYSLYTGTTLTVININTNNSQITITNNNLYEPSQVIPTSSGIYWGIYILSTAGNQFNISNNYIGGSSAGCVGTFTKSNAFANGFTAIYSTVSTSSNTTNIQGNTIKNIDWRNPAAKYDFTCIQTFGNAINVGTTSGNTISNIYWEHGAISGAVFYGISIQNTAGLNTVQNNSISGITINNTDPAHGSNFYGLYKSSSAGEVNFSNNIIGGTATNSITANSTATANSQIVAGIYAYASSGSTTVTYKITASGNTIQNLNNSSSRTDVTNSTYGIYCTYTTTSTGSSNVYGAINNNKIYSLTASNATLPARVIGINMDVTSASTATTCYNNAISLGNSNPGLVYGIVQNTGLAKVDQNSVYIGGSPAAGSFESAALNVTGTTVGREFLNNIFYNTRSNTASATSKHYIIKYGAASNLTSNYNVVNCTGSGALLGAIGATDYTTSNTDIQNWVATGLDTNTKVATVNFTNAATGDLTLTGASIQDANLAVPLLAAVMTDFSGTNRGATTYAGAFQSTPYIFTAVNPVMSGSNILPTATGVKVSCSKLSDIDVYTVNGMLMGSVKSALSFETDLNAGVYLIKVNGKTTKFLK